MKTERKTNLGIQGSLSLTSEGVNRSQIDITLIHVSLRDTGNHQTSRRISQMRQTDHLANMDHSIRTKILLGLLDQPLQIIKTSFLCQQQVLNGLENKIRTKTSTKKKT